ncbi:MAG: hypothetical protein AAGI03_07270 [Pseudomonadota bacterium]
MTPRDRESLALSLGYAARRLDGALALAAPCGVLSRHVLRGVWRAACRELHYLELFMRRLLLCMAGDIAISPRAAHPEKANKPFDNKASKAPPSAILTGDTAAARDFDRGVNPSAFASPDSDTSALPPASPESERTHVHAAARPGAIGSRAIKGGDQPENRDKSPLFPVSDPRPGEKALQRRLAAMGHWEGELPTVPVGSIARANGGTPAPTVCAARLAIRFAALADALARPSYYALRIARLRACRAKAILRLGAVPGLARGGYMDLATSSYFEAERLALTVLNRGWQDPPPGPDPPPDGWPAFLKTP